MNVEVYMEGRLMSNRHTSMKSKHKCRRTVSPGCKLSCWYIVELAEPV